jgi:aminoglycoside phosphotransferase (APT) family kinase protein
VDDTRFLVPNASATVLAGRRLHLGQLRRRGLVVRRYRTVGRYVVPIGAGPAALEAVTRHVAERRWWWRVAGRVAGRLIGRGLAPANVAIASSADAPPRLLSEAARFGVDPNGPWYLERAEDHPRSRSVFVVYGAGAPAWVVKFGRLADAGSRFDAEERGFSVARAMGHAPLLLGRFDVDGAPASVETAAAGRSLLIHLLGATPKPAKLATIDAVAGWLVSVAAAAAQQAPPVRELDYLEREVVPRWVDRGAPKDLVDRVRDLPAVPTHGDLAPTNVIVDGDRFTAVDWEDAQLDGLALSDLIDFLLGALGTMDDRERVLLGQSELSPVFARWLERGRQALSLDSDTVRTLVTMRVLNVAVAWRRYAERDLGLRADVVLPEERLAVAWLGLRPG